MSKRTFSYLDHFAFWRVVSWIRKRHAGLAWKTIRRRYLPGWQLHADGIGLFRCWKVAVSRYRFRGSRIPTPWASTDMGAADDQRPELVESRMR
jgi:RNA-directed DNA polymerase